MCKFAILLLCVSLAQNCQNPTNGEKLSLRKTDNPTSNPTHQGMSETENLSSPYEKEIILDCWLKLNISSEIIIQKLGVPVHKGEVEESGNTGVLTQMWEYPQYGLYLLMDLNNSDHIVQLYGIEVVYPCAFKTLRHIGIGSSMLNLQQAYPEGRYSNNYFSIGDPYGICMNFKIAADTVTSISIFQDFD